MIVRCRYGGRKISETVAPSEEAERVRTGHVAPAALPREQLAEVRVRQRQLGAEAEAAEEAQDREPREVRRERGGEREARVDHQVDEEHPPPADVVSHGPEQDRAEEHAAEARRDDERLAARAEPPLLREHRGEDAAEEDVVEVEEV